MELRNISDSQLHNHLQSMIASERKLVAETIESIKEVDRRQLYLAFQCTSLFQYLTEKMGYTPGSAQRRIDAARLLRDIPELKENLRSGELNLMQVSTLARNVREKEKSQTVSIDEKRNILAAIKSHDILTSEKTIAQMLDVPIKVQETKCIQKDESLRVEITFSKDQRELLEEVKMLMSHVNPNPSVAEIFEYLGKQYIQRKRGLKSTDDGCQWEANGKKCGSRFQLQNDHIVSKWAGGSNGPDNLQKLCGFHNRLKYKNEANIRRKV